MLIVVTGAPGSGKSTIAQPLARRLGVPLAAKDDVKEALWDDLGAGGRDHFLLLGRASYAMLLWFARSTLAAGGSVVVEANFTPDWAADELGRLHETSPFGFVQILCLADPATCLARFRERESSRRRHPMHAVGGEETLASLEQRLRDGVWERPIPFGADPIVLDTNGPVDDEWLVAEVRRRLDAHRD